MMACALVERERACKRELKMTGVMPLLRARIAGLVLCAWCVVMTPQQPDQRQGDSSRFQINVNRVLVPVVVRDKAGRSMDDLKAEDFDVFDDGKKRLIANFTIERRGKEAGAPSSSPESTQAAVAGADGVILPERITVFLFDDMHLSAEDLAHARAAGLKEMSGALRGTDMVAVVSISGRVNTGLTRDPSTLQSALTRLSPQGLYQSDTTNCPYIDYYEADLIENKHDPIAIQDGNQKYANCNPAITTPQDVGGGVNLPTAENLVESAAMQALSLGNQDVQSTYAGIAFYVQRMAALPGQRTLILVSPGFLNIEQNSLLLESKIIDLAVRSNVTISTLDARGLYTTEMTASQHSPALAGQSFQTNSGYQRSAMRLAENPMAELADGTGGTFFHNSNDLNSGLKELTEAPVCTYVLELALDGVKQDGKYHSLKVKVSRKDAHIEARRGYFMPKAAKHP